MTAAALAIAALALGAIALREWMKDDDLIKHGVLVMATVKQAGESAWDKRPQPPDAPVILHFTWNGQERDTPQGKLDGRKNGEFISMGDKIPIRVNPNDPNDWTPRLEPLPLMHRAMGVGVAFPLALLAAIYALVLRNRLARAWRNGLAIEALVLETRIPAVAPSCRAARVTPSDEGDSRIYTVYLPPRLAGLNRGEPIFILRPTARSSSAVAASWFE